MASRGINLHPSGHHPSTLSTKTFDVIIIGGGPVGMFARTRLALSGLKVAIIIAELFGGDCANFACIPSKALLRPLEALKAAKSVGGAREAVGDIKLDVNATFQRRDQITNNWDDTRLMSFQPDAKTMTLIRGVGRIAGDKKVTVQPHGENELYELTATHAVIVATGSAHIVPSIQGIDQLEEGKQLWTNRDATASNIVPEHLIILGGGAVGTEMATFYSGVGSQVTLINSSAEILSKVEPEAAQLVHKSLEDGGVAVKTSTTATKVEKTDDGIIVTLSNGEKISGTVLLNAIGRKPRTTDIGLETIGLPGDGAPLVTHASLAAKGAGSWLYAIGDVNSLGPTTHMGMYQARIAANNILASIQRDNPSSKLTPPRNITSTEARDFKATFPQVIFSEPSISAVGYTLASAKAAGLKVRAVDNDFRFPQAMLYSDDAPGWARWVVEEETDRLVGATYCCIEASEFVNAATVAIIGGLTVKDLVHVVPPFPTRGEVLRILVDAAGY